MEDEAPDPCPAAFDYLASLLLSWCKVPTLDRWAESGPAIPRPWEGSSKRCSVGTLGKLCAQDEEDEGDEGDEEPLSVPTWPEIQKRQDRMAGR